MMNQTPFAACLVTILALLAGPARAQQWRYPREVPQNTPVTIELPQRGRPARPYDRDALAVTAHVTTPDGRTLRVPCYYEEGFDPLFGVKTREDGWRLTFCGEMPGRHTVQIKTRRKGGVARGSVRGVITVTPSDTPGMVDTAHPPNGYFVRRGGGPFFPIGLNFAWGDDGNPARYLEQLDYLARNGVGCIRLWLAPWWLQVETGPGVYDQRACALLDQVLQRCLKNNIAVIVCLTQHAAFETDVNGRNCWAGHPYNRAQGGPCATPDDFFTDAEARRLFRHRLTYLVARYGAYPCVMAWELFNEVEHFPFGRGGLEENRRPVLEWHREMAGHLRATDPYGHLVATSSDDALQRALLLNGLIDFVQLHVYGEGVAIAPLAGRTTEAAAFYGVPVIAGEFGPRDDAWAAQSIVGGTWAAAAGGGAVGGLYWWHTGDALKDGWTTFAALRKAVEGIRWGREAMAPVTATAQALHAETKPVDVTLSPAQPFGSKDTGVATVLPDGRATGGDTLPAYLLGADQQGGGNACVIDINAPSDGTLKVRVVEVSGGTTLRVAVDGEAVGETVLIAGPNNTEAKSSRWVEKWNVYIDTYERDYAFDLPAGKHRVTLENAARGWIHIGPLTFEGMCRGGGVRAVACAVAGRENGLAYLRALGAEGGGRADHRFTLTLRGVPDGTYAVTWFDCLSGAVLREETGSSRDGHMTLSTPPLKREVGVRLRRRL